jgi:hypothetical protein
VVDRITPLPSTSLLPHISIVFIGRDPYRRVTVS